MPILGNGRIVLITPLPLLWTWNPASRHNYSKLLYRCHDHPAFRSDTISRIVISIPYFGSRGTEKLKSREGSNPSSPHLSTSYPQSQYISPMKQIICTYRPESAN